MNEDDAGGGAHVRGLGASAAAAAMLLDRTDEKRAQHL